MNSDNISRIMRRRYNLESRITDSRYPTTLISICNEMLERCKGSLEESGITEENYISFVNEFQLDIEADNVSLSNMMDCFHRARYVQDEEIAGNNLSSEICKFKDSDDECCICPNYKKMTDEEDYNYTVGIDIETGKEILSEGIDWYGENGGN